MERPVKAAYAYISRCAPAHRAKPIPTGRFKVRLDNGETFRLTEVYGVSCADYSGGDDHEHGKGYGRGEPHSIPSSATAPEG